MILRVPRVAVAFLAITSSAFAIEPAPLPPDQLAKAIKTDSLTIPTPGELFAALEKPGKPDWAGQYRTPIPMTYRNRAQIALNLGGRVMAVTAALLTTQLANVMPAGNAALRLAHAAGTTAVLVLVAALALSHWLPEPAGERLPQ